MKNFTNQRGLAALEVVIVAAIVAIFATAAVPKMARILDKVQLDYEMKHLYSTLNLARSLGKNSVFYPVVFSGIEKQSNNVELQIHKNNDTVAKNCYEIVRQSTSSTYYMHYLRNGVTLYFDGSSPLKIHFDNANQYSDANSKTITLTSKFGEAYVISNSVGRFRGSYEKPKS